MKMIYGRTHIISNIKCQDFKVILTCINRCERPCFNRYRPKHVYELSLILSIRNEWSKCHLANLLVSLNTI